MKDVTGIFTHGVNGFGGMQKVCTKMMYFIYCSISQRQLLAKLLTNLLF